MPSNWLIDEKILNSDELNFLVHGEDDENWVLEDRIAIFSRTDGIRSNL